MEEKSSSNRIISAADLDTSVPAIPYSVYIEYSLVICGVNAIINSSTHSNADVGLAQSGRIVDTVTCRKLINANSATRYRGNTGHSNYVANVLDRFYNDQLLLWRSPT
ncbi:hypothetical protein Zmor_016397 [Zophobas morio]|uniref:Uncharacterized protein n=1 Tax=Zophobas morio TaxID=2755281 RepID=A0AA38HE41_9CUCU|nr:hypothetical protein Zmor_016397 [Zophobas morio]